MTGDGAAFGEGAGLALTLLIEAPVVMALLARAQPSRARRLAAGMLPSLFTHPFAWRTVHELAPPDQLAGWAVVEGLVVLLEALMIWPLARVGARRAALASVVANGASAAVGWGLSWALA